MKRTALLTAFVAVVGLVFGSTGLKGEDEDNGLRTRLTGFQEVPPILTNGKGTLTLTIGSSSIAYTLTFSDLSSSATMSHIHFGERGVSGAIFVFLCGGGGKPTCPAGGGTVTGTITGADVLAVPAQGITAGSFTDLLRILRSGDAYANVHTTDHLAGEIRGQISPED